MSIVKNNTQYLWRAVFILIALWYVTACGVHYFSQRPLWNDELAVFDSIQDFYPSDFFTRELETFQVFPRLYLFYIQSFAKLFDNSVLSLRFFSLVCMMAAFAVWVRVARRELKNPLEFLAFVLCWAASAPLIYYSAELKQYSMDVLVSGIFMSFLYTQEKLRSSVGDRRYMMMLVFLPVLVMFSYPAYFFLAFPLWNLAAAVKTDRSQLKFILAYFCSLVVFVTCSYLFDIRLRPVDIVSFGFNDYFISTDSVKGFFQTFGEFVNNIFSRWFVELPKVYRKLARFFMLFGLVTLFAAFFKDIGKGGWKFVSVSTVALVVFAELVCVGMLRKYPVGVPRTVLFFCPMLLILTLQGISSLKTLNRYVYFLILGAFLIYLSVVAVGLFGAILAGPIDAIPTIWAY